MHLDALSVYTLWERPTVCAEYRQEEHTIKNIPLCYKIHITSVNKWKCMWSVHLTWFFYQWQHLCSRHKWFLLLLLQIRHNVFICWTRKQSHLQTRRPGVTLFMLDRRKTPRNHPEWPKNTQQVPRAPSSHSLKNFVMEKDKFKSRTYKPFCLIFLFFIFFVYMAINTP